MCVSHAFARVLLSACADTSLICALTAFVIIGNGNWGGGYIVLQNNQNWTSLSASGPFPQGLYARVRQKVFVITKIWRGSQIVKNEIGTFPSNYDIKHSLSTSR
jgi:hypothetical protein